MVNSCIRYTNLTIQPYLYTQRSSIIYAKVHFFTSFYFFLQNCPQSLGVNGAIEIPGIVFGDFVKSVY